MTQSVSSTAIDYAKISKDLIAGLKSNNRGASVFSHAYEAPAVGYLVSIRKYNKQVSTSVTQAVVTRWVKKNIGNGTVLGSWDAGNNVWHLDVNEWFMTPQRAWILGAIEGEKAVYDVVSGEDVAIPAELAGDPEFQKSVEYLRTAADRDIWPYGQLGKP